MTGVDDRRARFGAAAFAVLATHGPDGRLDLVPCCFAFDGDDVVTVIDHKPKRTQRLARLVNIERDPAVSLLVDHRDVDDWSALWWIRAHGRARIEVDGDDHRRAIDVLAAKYRQYAERRPMGPVIRIAIDRWVGWSP